MTDFNVGTSIEEGKLFNPENAMEEAMCQVNVTEVNGTHCALSLSFSLLSILFISLF